MARFVLYTNTISPHQLPLAREIAARVGDNNFRYIYTEVTDKDHDALGWTLDVPGWCISAESSEAEEWLENGEVLLSGLRCLGLFERRAAKALKNLYMTERWFKPPVGFLRLLHPRYLRYAWRLFALLESGAVVGLPIGVHSARDMARLCGLMHGDLRCLFSVPELVFERKPGGRVFSTAMSEKKVDKYCLDKMKLWGYYVEPSKKDTLPVPKSTETNLDEIKVLWVGRLLDLKRVDVIVRAVSAHADLKRVDVSLPKITLDIYGTGPEEARLKKLASDYSDCIKFYPPVPIGEVRKLMREHDVYVLASNAYEGWGAVVSEALEEGMKVIGTYEAGASATILPEESLFHAGDTKLLRNKLENLIDSRVDVDIWSPKRAAAELVNM